MSFPLEYSAGKRGAIEHPPGIAGCDGIQASKRSCSGVCAALPHVNLLHSGLLARVPGTQDQPECGFLGVRWNRKKNKWRVRIKANGKDNHVGFFIDPLAAAMAYDKAVKKFNANWATDPATKLNFPPGADVAYRFGPGLEVASLADLASASGVAAGSPLQSGSSASSRPGSVAPMAGRGSTSSIGLGLHQPFLALGRPGQSDTNMLAIARASVGAPGNDSPAAVLTPAASSLSPLQHSMCNVMLSASSSSMLRASSSSPRALSNSRFSPPMSSGSGSTILAPLLPQNAHAAANTRVGAWKIREEKSAETESEERLAHLLQRRQEKGALEHLLNHKSALARTPSPALVVTPKNNMGSSTSTPTPTPTLPSPSIICSPPGEGQWHRCKVDTPPGLTAAPHLAASARESPADVGHGQGGEGGAARAQPSASTSMGEEEVLRTLRDMKKSKKEQFFMRHDASRATCRGKGEDASQDVPQDVTCSQSAGKHRRYSGALAGSPLPLPLPSPGGMVPPTARMAFQSSGPHSAPLHRHHHDSSVVRDGTSEEVDSRHFVPKKKDQTYRGVTWDKVKQMWRVRLCLAGGGREHVGYFANEEEGAWAYHCALQRLKGQSASPANRADSPNAAVQQQFGAAVRQQPASKEPERRGGVAAAGSYLSVAHRPQTWPSAEQGRQGAFSHVHDHASVTPGREALLLNAHVNSTQVQQTYSSQFANHQRLTVNLGLGVVGAASTPLLSSQQPLGSQFFNVLPPASSPRRPLP